MKIIYLREICKNNQPGADISHEYWGCWPGRSYSSISQNGPGPPDPRIHPQNILRAWGRALESASLGPWLRNIGLALWVGGRDLMWFEGNLLLK